VLPAAGLSARRHPPRRCQRQARPSPPSAAASCRFISSPPSAADWRQARHPLCRCQWQARCQLRRCQRQMGAACSCGRSGRRIRPAQRCWGRWRGQRRLGPPHVHPAQRCERGSRRQTALRAVAPGERQRLVGWHPPQPPRLERDRPLQRAQAPAPGVSTASSRSKNMESIGGQQQLPLTAAERGAATAAPLTAAD
jgi:hypothetical protein